MQADYMTKQEDDSRDSDPEAIKKFLQGLSIYDILDEDLDRYLLAFTHKSFAGWETSYERLEFLGDRVLNFIVAKYLFEKNPENSLGSLSPGQMSDKMECVKNINLSRFVEKQFPDLDNLIIRQKNLKITRKIRADVFEAFIGALYLHKQFKETERIVLSIFEDEIRYFDPNQDYITMLKEELDSKEIKQLKYEMISEEGRDHEPTYYFRVIIDGKEMGTGSGSTKDEAKQKAAKDAIEKRIANSSQN